MADVAVDFLLENLNQLLNCNNPLIPVEKDQMEFLYEELVCLRIFLKDSEESRYEHEKLKNLVTKIEDVAYEAEDIVDSFVVSALIQKNGSIAAKSSDVFDCSPKLVDVMQEIKSIKAEIMEICDDMNIYGTGVVQSGKSSDGSSSSSRENTSTRIVDEDIIVGLDDEALIIVERLAGDEKQLDVISIVGMAGLGKTTLAKKVYNHPLVAYHFYIRAWICVSQAYRKRDLILGLLNSADLLTDEIHKMSNDRLPEELYRRLKGKRYLIVIDDIWDIKAWKDLKRSFPNDNNGSRIMLTSRLKDVVLHAKPDISPHFLRFLTEDQSWDLLQQKVFRKNSCPQGLIEIGKKIARKCEGLPLAVVVIAGLLAKTEMTLEWWKRVSQSVSSYIVRDREQYMETLALSYNHLPHHLKACFLYLGAFPEDYEIPARKLILLWIAEGFIRQKGQKRVEEVAEESLMDLIDRSLVIVAQRRSDGGIKTCRIHDLLHDLCSRKAEEEEFLHHIYSRSMPITKKQRRLYIHINALSYISSKPCAPHARSFLCFDLDWDPSCGKEPSFIYEAFKHIRVLDLRSICITFIPSEIERLALLRHLAIRPIVTETLPASVCNLWNLETLIVDGLIGAIKLPNNIGKMVKLRHLYIQRETFMPRSYDCPFLLYNLQTITTIALGHWNEQVLPMIPNIRKLGCNFWESFYGPFPKLDCLIHLETLKVSNYVRVTKLPVKFSPTYKFPTNLKKLTLSRFHLPWTEMSTIGRLPNLEVLKLLDEAFKGPVWDTSDEEFLQLKSLKFQNLDIEQWNACSRHFPNLQRLVVVRCRKLVKIPYGLGDISTLEMIEITYSRRSAMISARKIQRDQQSNGNDGLKILVYPHIEVEIEEDEALENANLGLRWLPIMTPRGFWGYEEEDEKKQQRDLLKDLEKPESNFLKNLKKQQRDSLKNLKKQQRDSLKNLKKQQKDFLKKQEKGAFSGARPCPIRIKQPNP